MRGGIRNPGGAGGAYAALVALVLLFRLLIPTGYMIGATGEGGTGLVLCGPAVPVPEHHPAHHKAPAKTDQAPCPYAALAAPALPPAPPLSPPPPAVEPTPAPAWTGNAVDSGPAAPPPPATGPPLSV